MAAKPLGNIKRLWYQWKMLRLPWRKQFLIGTDLLGNTYWEFRETLSSQRFRRIVRYSSNPSIHYADVKISPAWHQWLRHVRWEAPTIQEQQMDIQRLANVKQLAQLADERWEAKGRIVLEAPEAARSREEVGRVGVGPIGRTEGEGVEEQGKEAKRTKKNPWQEEIDRKAKGAGEAYQPGSWTPGMAKRR